MQRIKHFFGYDWAMEVKSRPWAAWASFLEIVKRASRYKLCVDAHHRSWEHAVGVR